MKFNQGAADGPQKNKIPNFKFQYATLTFAAKNQDYL